MNQLFIRAWESSSASSSSFLFVYFLLLVVVLFCVYVQISTPFVLSDNFKWNVVTVLISSSFQLMDLFFVLRSECAAALSSYKRNAPHLVVDVIYSTFSRIRILAIFSSVYN